MKQTSGDSTAAEPIRNMDFTDRDEYMAICEQAFDKLRSADGEPPDTYRVIVWWGVGGQGNTEILWEFVHRIRARRKNGNRNAVGIVDFKEPPYHDPVKALLKLRSDLSGQGDISFETFDTAYVQMFKLEHPGRDPHEAHDTLAEYGGASGVLEFVETMAGEVPLGAVLFKYGKEMLAPRVHDWWQSDDVKPLANEIQATTSPSRLKERLPRYFGFDLRRSMLTESPPRIVMVFDHHHALTTSGTAVATQADRWLRTLIQASPGALTMIFGRNPLGWSDDDPFWQPPVLVQHPTGGFPPEDARDYLACKGVTDDAICTRIVEGAHGVPMHLAQAARQYRDIVKDGRAPTVDDFGRTPAEAFDKFIDHLSESGRSNLRIASYPKAIDEALFLDLVDEFPGHVSGADWAQLTGESLMHGTATGLYTMHPATRDELQFRERERSNVFFARVHRFLFDHYRIEAGRADVVRELGAADDRALVAAAGHLARSEPQHFPAWLLDHDRTGQTQLFSDGDRWLALLQVFEIAAAADSSVYSDEDRLWLGHHHAHVLQMTGCFDEARALFEKALESHEAIFADPSPQQVLERATIVHALADVHRQLDAVDTVRSEAHYRRALDLYNVVPEGFEQRRVDVKFSLGLLRDAAGDAAGANALYDNAKRMNVALHTADLAPYAKFLTQLGEAHRTYGRYGDALTNLEEARSILEGDEMPDDGVGIVLLEIANCQAHIGEKAAAEASYTRAISLIEEHAGSEHANYAHALHRQACFWLRDSRRREAAHAQIERAVLTLKETVGDKHEWTRQALADLEASGAAT